MNKAIGLYLHIPFCQRKCLYCDFYSLTELEKREAYTKKLVKVIKESGKTLQRPLCDTIYFGGGTPSLLNTKQLYSILDAVTSGFSLKDPQITLEANPGTTDLTQLREMRELGINRISLGIQSCCDKELKTLGRLHDSKQALDCAKAVYKAGFEKLSVDLMYALPNQEPDSVKKSLNALLELEPGHVSSYCLTLSDSVPLSKLDLSYPEDSIQQQMYLYICETLENSGLKRYEISNFAKKGEESLHNLKYWNRENVLGLGPGAYSLLNGKRFSFESDLDRFIKEEPRSLICDLETLSPEDAAEEYIMLSLRTAKGFRWSEYSSLASDESVELLKSTLAKKLELWVKGGLVENSPEGFSLTHKGAFVSNYIISDLI